MPTLRFIAFCIAVAISYGILHDLVTAHIAVEYFTIHHERLIESTSPLAMAVLWGVVATWWVGLIGGILLVSANLVGRWPRLEWGWLRGLVVRATVISLGFAMLLLASLMVLTDRVPIGERGPTYEKDRRLVAVAVTHGASYTMAVVSILAQSTLILVKRKRMNLIT